VDSIVNNEAGFKNGVFQNSQTDLLPWPDAKRGTSFFDAIDVDYGSRHKIPVIPNPYDPLKGGLVIVDFNIIYYNADGSIRWNLTTNDIVGSTAYFENPTRGNGESYVITLIDNVPHLLGRLSINYDSSVRFFTVNLENITHRLSSIKTPKANSPFIVESLGILEDGTVFAVYYNSGKTIFKSCEVDMTTLSQGLELPDVGLIRTEADQNGWITNGIALFNGSVVMVKGGTFGINPDLDMSISKTNKRQVITRHREAVNEFTGIYQVSKDMFIGVGNSQTLYLDRPLLEKWVSDCIHATTNFRIQQEV